MLNRNEIKTKVIQEIEQCYTVEQKKLVGIGVKHQTEGEIRYAAGVLVENILQKIFDTINSFLGNDKIISKVGSTDYLKKETLYKGKIYTNNKIQVDRHVWYQGKRIAFIENKTYLDSCYYDRALADFKKICQALLQAKQNPCDCLFIVFAGQKAGRENTFLTYEAEFWHETKSIINKPFGIEPKTIYFLTGTRNSARPLYKIKHNLNYAQIELLVDMILNQIEK